MAKFSMGALTSYVKGSTKNSTFRNTKAGVVVYDRIDPAKWGGKYGNDTILSRAQFNFMVACDLAAKLGVLPANATMASKKGTKYNEFVRVLIDADPYKCLILEARSAMYGEQPTIGNWNTFFAGIKTSESYGDYQAAGYLLADFLVGSSEGGNNSAQLTKGVGNATFNVTKVAAAEQKITISNLVNKSRKVKVLVIDYMQASNFAVVDGLIPALGSVTLTGTLALNQVTGTHDAFVGDYAAYFIVMVDNRPVNASGSQVICGNIA